MLQLYTYRHYLIEGLSQECQPYLATLLMIRIQCKYTSNTIEYLQPTRPWLQVFASHTCSDINVTIEYQ